MVLWLQQQFSVFINWLSREEVYMETRLQIPFMTIQYPSGTRPHNTDKDCLVILNGLITHYG